MMIARLLVPAALGLAAGCATTPAPTAQPVTDGTAAAAAVVLCRTTVAELDARLGPSSRDGRLHGTRIVSWITAWEPLVRYLAVQVDGAGVVTDIAWNLPSEIPWTPTSQCGPR
ncbi:MAG TPA: hypothetical protein VLK29_10325 [Luteimonas sp.]|nr:hypothetical protein [Luteimonas sp.]